jgi:hypothetical protein
MGIVPVLTTETIKEGGGGITNPKQTGIKTKPIST